MTKTDPVRAPGYRGSLPARHDRLARPWILTVIGAFVLVLALSLLGIPSRFIPDPTPIPLPSTPGSQSAEPSASVSASTSAEPSSSGSPSVEPSPTAE